MATVNDKELEYLPGQHLARLAIADASGEPAAVPATRRVLGFDSDLVVP
jgi:hypothetical protein